MSGSLWDDAYQCQVLRQRFFNGIRSRTTKENILTTLGLCKLNHNLRLSFFLIIKLTGHSYFRQQIQVDPSWVGSHWHAIRVWRIKDPASKCVVHIFKSASSKTENFRVKNQQIFSLVLIHPCGSRILED